MNLSRLFSLAGLSCLAIALTFGILGGADGGRPWALVLGALVVAVLCFVMAGRTARNTK